MPIPSQNEVLVPFLESLRDGQPHSRSQILGALAKHFELSETELNETSGQQLTVISRMAWCDTYFVKAGFVQKERHAKDSLQDRFRITPTGQLQLQRHASRIDVAYLQSFYRGRIYRGAASRDTSSDAELDLYERLDNLPEPWTVFHSISWFAQKDGYGTIGELDFLIAHPDHGLLVLEVKGGELSIQREGNQNVWYSRSRSGFLNEIQDPCAQANRNRRQLVDYFQVNQFTKRFHYALFPAVAAPDSVIASDIRMDCPQDIFIDQRHLDRLEERLLQIFAYWKPRADLDNKQMDGQPAINALVDALVPSRKLNPRLAETFKRERRKIDQLTEQQFRVLRSLRAHRRAAIVGGAGTGKTMLAMEKAQQLASDGMNVLFLAFNRNIVEWVEKSIGGPSISVYTYHAFVGKAQYLAGSYRSRNMNQEEFISKAADLLLDAAQTIRNIKPQILFDAIIVDEGQDFDDSMWIPLPDLLKDPEGGILYIFFDDNQRLYTQISNIPMETTPFYLVDNCRNTQRIHTSMQPFTSTETDSYCDGPEGRDVELIPTSDAKAAVRELQRLLHRLVNEEGISAEEIIILTPKSERNSQWKSDMPLGNFILSWNMQTEMPLAIRVCTIFSFKGLESSVIILSELDKAPADIVKQIIYVGLSRARHHVVVLGHFPNAI
jgi:DNA-binding MarR family transcriptional regulator